MDLKIPTEQQQIVKERGVAIANGFFEAIASTDNLTSINHALNCVMFGFARLAYRKGHSLESVSHALLGGLTGALTLLEQQEEKT